MPTERLSMRRIRRCCISERMRVPGSSPARSGSPVAIDGGDGMPTERLSMRRIRQVLHCISGRRRVPGSLPARWAWAAARCRTIWHARARRGLAGHWRPI